MSDDKSELAKQAQELGKSKASDHIANIVKATLNVVPFVGGSIASLIDDYIPESRQKRIEEFSKNLADEMERLGDSLDANYVKTDEFAYLFTRVYQDVTRDYQQEKLVAYRNILVNALRVEVDASIQERYLYLVEQLTPLHLRVLSAFVSDHRNEAQMAKEPNRMSNSLSQTLKWLLPDLAESQIESCIFDLDQMGITAGVKNTLKTMMTEHGARQLEGRLTGFGRSFLNFISQA
ncbi:MAG: hypothetical protein KF812_13305 [Fimbriimonadaceae bacterium]|nr:hypothetical protein [Fimbriimonadaceae bacterium]